MSFLDSNSSSTNTPQIHHENHHRQHPHPHHHHHHHRHNFDRIMSHNEDRLSFINGTMTTLLQERSKSVQTFENEGLRQNPQEPHHSHYQLSKSHFTSENLTYNLDELKTAASATMRSIVKSVQEVFTETELIQMDQSDPGGRAQGENHNKHRNFASSLTNATFSTVSTMFSLSSSSSSPAGTMTMTTPTPFYPYSPSSAPLTGASDGLEELRGASASIDPERFRLQQELMRMGGTVVPPESFPFQKLLYSVIIPMMLLCCVLSSVVNLVIVLSVRWCRKPMSPTLYFSISLALADAFASFVVGAGLVVNSFLPVVFDIWLPSYCFPLVLEAFRLGGVLVAVTHLLALAINHWMGIVRPLQYEATMTRGTALRIIVISWICPMSFFLLYFSSIANQGFRSDYCDDNGFMKQRTFRFIFASFFFAPLILMIFIYGHIFIIVRNHLHYRLKYQIKSCQQLQRNVKAVVTTVLILGTYTVGWMPAIVFYITVCDNCAYTVRQLPKGVVVPVNMVINTLLIMKAFVDPIIYAARMADIQAALKKMRYELLMYLFGSCVPPRSPPTGQLESGSVRFTKSFRMSSRGSSSRSNV